jgi:hypothetical protein
MPGQMACSAKSGPAPICANTSSMAALCACSGRCSPNGRVTGPRADTGAGLSRLVRRFVSQTDSPFGPVRDAAGDANDRLQWEPHPGRIDEISGDSHVTLEDHQLFERWIGDQDGFGWELTGRHLVQDLRIVTKVFSRLCGQPSGDCHGGACSIRKLLPEVAYVEDAFPQILEFDCCAMPLYVEGKPFEEPLTRVPSSMSRQDHTSLIVSCMVGRIGGLKNRLRNPKLRAVAGESARLPRL